MLRRALPLLLLLVLTSTEVSRASAQDPYRCLDSLSDAEVSYRLRWITRRMESSKRRARIYWYGWLAFSVGASAFVWTQFGLAGDDDVKRHANLFSGIGTIGLLGQVSGMSLTAAFAPQRIAARSTETPEERRETLRYATRLLERAASREVPATRRSSHLLPAVWAGWTGTFLAVRHRGEDGVALSATMAYLMPFVLTEARLWTQPRQSIRDFSSYRGWACSGHYVPTPEDEFGELLEETRTDEGAPTDALPEESDELEPPAPEAHLGVGPGSFVFTLRF